MIEKINEFSSLSRELRHQYEIFLFTNNNKHAENVLRTINDVQRLLPELRKEITKEKNRVNYYEKEFSELERILAPNIKSRRERKHSHPSYLKGKKKDI